MFSSAVVPCGPKGGHAANGGKLLGFTPCISGNCSHALTVYLDKTGVIRGCCFQAQGGCGSKHEIRGETFPEHSAADLEQFRDDIAALPTFHREQLARSWSLSLDQLKDLTDGKPLEVPAEHAPARREGPGNPAPAIREIPAETAGNPGGGDRAMDGGANAPAAREILDEPRPESPGPGERATGGFLSWDN